MSALCQKRTSEPSVLVHLVYFFTLFGHRPWVGPKIRDQRASTAILRKFAVRFWKYTQDLRTMSALPPKADIGTQSRHVRFVPKADICGAANGCKFDHSPGRQRRTGHQSKMP